MYSYFISGYINGIKGYKRFSIVVEAKESNVGHMFLEAVKKMILDNEIKNDATLELKHIEIMTLTPLGYKEEMPCDYCNTEVEKRKALMTTNLGVGIKINNYNCPEEDRPRDGKTFLAEERFFYCPHCGRKL